VTYAIEFRPAALRDLKTLSVDLRKRIGRKIDSLAGNPRPPGVEKLSGREDSYRVRVGDYRIIYEIRDQVLLVIIVEVGHRREVYR
jgi:mRNA interferase RelE/StbE